MKKIAAAIAAVALTVSLSSCSLGKMSEPFKDAERSGSNDGPASTITFPDGFSNAATKCDNGNRVYVIYHADSPYGSIAVVPNDESCQGVGG